MLRDNVACFSIVYLIFLIIIRYVTVTVDQYSISFLNYIIEYRYNKSAIFGTQLNLYEHNKINMIRYKRTPENSPTTF